MTAKAKNPLVLFHGTSSARLQGLAKTGLRTSVYLTDKMEVARYFADDHAAHDQTGYAKNHPKPVILRVAIRDSGRLRVDRRMLEFPIPYVLDKYDIDPYKEWRFHEAVKEGEIWFPHDEKDWRGSLEAVSSVQYDGSISPHDIEVLLGNRWVPIMRV